MLSKCYMHFTHLHSCKALTPQWTAYVVTGNMFCSVSISSVWWHTCPPSSSSPHPPSLPPLPHFSRLHPVCGVPLLLPVAPVLQGRPDTQSHLLLVWKPEDLERHRQPNNRPSVRRKYWRGLTVTRPLYLFAVQEIPLIWQNVLP